MVEDTLPRSRNTDVTASQRRCCPMSKSRLHQLPRLKLSLRMASTIGLVDHLSKFWIPIWKGTAREFSVEMIDFESPI